MNLVNNIYISISILLSVSLIFILVQFGLSVFLSAIILVFFSLFLHNLNFFTKINTKKLILFSILLSLLLISIVSNIFDKYSPNMHLILTFFYISTAYWLFYQKIVILKNVSLVLLLIYYIWFLFNGLEIGFLPQHVNVYFDGYSRNMVSSIAIIFQIFYSLSMYRYKGVLPKLTPILTFVLSVTAYGRTGIALSFIIIFYSLFKDFKIQAKYYKLTIITITVLLSILFMQNIDLILEYINISTNFGAGLSSPRSIFINDYVNTLNFGTIIVGSDLSLIPSISMFENNPHNTYLLGHAAFGIIYIIVMLSVLLYSLYIILFYNNTLTYFLFLTIYMTKFATDTGGLFGPSDILFYYMLFCLHKSKENGYRNYVYVILEKSKGRGSKNEDFSYNCSI